jgi:hypothetical protein
VRKRPLIGHKVSILERKGEAADSEASGSSVWLIYGFR